MPDPVINFQKAMKIIKQIRGQATYLEYNEPRTLKLANLCAIEGQYSYEVISLHTGEKRLVERVFSDSNAFVTCEADETINFGDISPFK